MVGNQFLDRRAIAEPWPTRLVGRVQLAKDLSDSVPLLFVPTIPQCGRQIEGPDSPRKHWEVGAFVMSARGVAVAQR